ncbi:MAG: hypothetical protein M1821_007832 [Bathelium mastoideum]|nr:MAG: hypothetical protein M1821_007832 [Bathelium mastoideum]
MQKRVLVASKNSDEDTRYASRPKLSSLVPARILIIGAGVSGLALAQGLSRRSIAFSVFERDPYLDSRFQSYRIKIAGHLKDELRDLLTDESWAEFEATCAETQLGETTLNAPDGAVLASRKSRLSKGSPRPWTVDRGMLRKSLMKSIAQDVHFDKKFVRYEIDQDEVLAIFEDGSEERGTLLVGADGRCSAVRRQFLPDNKPMDTDGCCIYGKSFLGPELIAQFPAKHRRWMTIVRDQTPLLESIKFGDSPISLVLEPVHFINQYRRSDLPADYVFWALLFHGRTSGLSKIQLSDSLKTRAAEMSKAMVEEWEPSIQSLLELQESSLTTGTHIYSVNPDMTVWNGSGHVTLMGDAIHVMPEPGGLGAVAALHDASTLVQTIAEHGVTASSIEQYEETMRSFAKTSVVQSRAAVEQLLALRKFDNSLEADW